MSAATRLIDVSHAVEQGMVTYKGLPAPVICDYLSREVDSFNIDSVDTGERPVHSILLGHEITIVEHLRGLAELPDRGSRFFAVPVKVRGFGTFPVRAFAVV
jgi:kynurenine formamidase